MLVRMPAYNPEQVAPMSDTEGNERSHDPSDAEGSTGPSAERGWGTESAFNDVVPPSSFGSGLANERDIIQFETFRPPFYYAEHRSRNALLLGGSTLIVGFGLIALILTSPHIGNRSSFVIVIAVVIALVVFRCVLVYQRMRSNQREVSEVAHSEVDESADQRRRPDDARTNNQQLIDRYHQLTTSQARTSYRNSQYAMTAGLAVLVSGTVVTLNAATATAQAAVGALTAVGSALSAYLGATFIRSHERALSQMNYYFGQPLVTSYILEAERLATGLSERKKDEVLTAIIEETLRGASNASKALSPSNSVTLGRPSSGGRRSVLRRARDGSEDEEPS